MASSQDRPTASASLGTGGSRRRQSGVPVVRQLPSRPNFRQLASLPRLGAEAKCRVEPNLRDGGVHRQPSQPTEAEGIIHGTCQYNTHDRAKANYMSAPLL